eukprot:974048-Alexandrium_andersonii.AAC.1
MLPCGGSSLLFAGSSFAISSRAGARIAWAHVRQWPCSARIAVWRVVDSELVALLFGNVGPLLPPSTGKF